MHLHGDLAGKPCLFGFAVVLLATGMCLPTARAQDQATTAPAKTSETKPAPEVYQTIFVSNATDQNSLNNLASALRTAIPRARIYVDTAQSAIAVRAVPEDVELAQRIVSDLDRPRKAYSLTYNITESESGQPKGTQKVMLITASGTRTVLKQGNRVPVVTSTSAPGDSGQSTQVQYIDVGLTIEATLDGQTGALALHSKIEQSSLATEQSSAGARDPDVLQTALDSVSTLMPGKPLLLGSLDIPGTTRHLEIEVVAEAVK